MSALPWTIRSRIHEDPDATVYIYSAHNGEVACLYSDDAMNDADFIAKACNAHQALVHGLQQILRSGTDPYTPEKLIARETLNKVHS